MIDPQLPLSWSALLDYRRDPLKYTGKLRDSSGLATHETLVQNHSIAERTQTMMQELGFTGISQNLYCLIENKYPYSIEKGLKQMVLFLNPNHDSCEINIPDIFGRYTAVQGFYDYLYFKQPLERQSLPTIAHYHVFFR